MFENVDVPKKVLQTFFSINDQMDEYIRAVEPKTSPEEYQAFQEGRGLRDG